MTFTPMLFLYGVELLTGCACIAVGVVGTIGTGKARLLWFLVVGAVLLFDGLNRLTCAEFTCGS